jgi:hypothetical protein
MNGYQIMDQIKDEKETIAILTEELDNSFFMFKDERKRHPEVILDALTYAFEVYGDLVQKQVEYNSTVQTSYGSIQKTIKLIGWYSNLRTTLRKAMQSKTGSARSALYGFAGDQTRNKEHEYAEKVLSLEELTDMYKSTSETMGHMKNELRKANMTELA